MKKIRMICTIGFIVLTTLPVMAAGKYPYLATAINELTELNLRSSKITPDDLQKSLNTTCSTLGQLLNDKNFRNDLDRIGPLDAKTREQRAAMKNDLSQFLYVFLPQEKTNLREFGLSEAAEDNITNSASALHNALDDKYDATRILTEIENLRRDACGASKTVANVASQNERAQIVRKWAFRIGGLTLAVADVAAVLPVTAATAGTATIVATGSVSIGVAVMGWGEDKR